MVAVVKGGAQIAERQHCDTDENRFLPPDMTGNGSDRNIADDRGYRCHHQAICIAAVFHSPDMRRITGESGSDSIIGNEP